VGDGFGVNTKPGTTPPSDAEYPLVNIHSY
jgi:hypothetical protein